MTKTIYINVAEKIGAPSALTQEQGNIIYNEIVSAIEKKNPILLDFEQVESMISAFLNNAIGQLYGKYTSQQISEFLKIINFPHEKTSTLNVVIANAKKYYSDRDNFNSAIKEVFNTWVQKTFILLNQTNNICL